MLTVAVIECLLHPMGVQKLYFYLPLSNSHLGVSLDPCQLCSRRERKVEKWGIGSSECFCQCDPFYAVHFFPTHNANLTGLVGNSGVPARLLAGSASGSFVCNGNMTFLAS